MRARKGGDNLSSKNMGRERGTVSLAGENKKKGVNVG